MSASGQPAAAAGTIKVGDLTVNRLGFGENAAAAAFRLSPADLAALDS